MRCLSVLLLLLAAPALECAQWTRISSTNFELYTTSSEEEGRETLATFEQTREFFLRAKSFLIPPALPVVVVAFSNAREYKPYSLKDFVPAYFMGDEQRDYIVMSDVGTQRTRVAVHEYVHVLVRHSGRKLPLWLNEGLAEVYAGMEARDGKILLGRIPTDRAYSLGSGNWMRLGTLLNVRSDSPEYNERDRGGMFYAQSCVLVHMLMLGDGYADKFPAFIDRITSGSGVSAQSVFAEVYGKSLAEVDKDMLSHFRQGTVGGADYKAVAYRAEVGPAREATPFEVELTLARLVGLLGRFEEAAARLERLSTAQPGNREIAEGQAYLAWRSGDQQAALRQFEQVFAQGTRSWKTCWDYARLLNTPRGDRAQRIDALYAALELRPEFAPARLMLARDLHAAGRLSDALSELRQVRDVDPQRAVEMYSMMARIAARLNAPKDARHYAEEARKHARTSEEIASVDGLVRELEGARSSTYSEPQEDDQRPILRRRSPPKRTPTR